MEWVPGLFSSLTDYKPSESTAGCTLPPPYPQVSDTSAACCLLPALSPFPFHEWIPQSYLADSFLDGVGEGSKVSGLPCSLDCSGDLGALKASCGRKNE